MTPEVWMQVKRIAGDALELSTNEVSGFLEEACAGDEALLEAVTSFLAGEETDGSLLRRSVQDLFGRDAGPSLGGRRIGPYLLEEELGHGGMGVVYRAVREGAFHKKVAVKLLKKGLETHEIVGRFKTERQILADLEHPNIARLYDGGATSDGLPYIVMEYIEGQPIDVYCASNHLSLRARLKLFLKVCGAVCFAHGKLVLHRDIKASNILVTTEGEPKLLDFGIASILDPLTAASQTIGNLSFMTPDYASPEQVRGERLHTTSDIYSLGALLYVLLVGRPPLLVRGLSSVEMVRVIFEQEPLKPSTAAGTSSAGANLQEKSRALRGDLDSIVLKCLRKRPWKRYGSVEQLGEDIRRFLVGLPVTAQRITLAYRLGKFLGRNWLPLSGASLITALVLTSTVVAWQARSRAELRQGQAEDLIGFMIGDLRNKLAPQRRLDVLADVSEEAQSYFATLGPREMTGETLARYARSLGLIGEVRLDQGDAAGAMESFSQALTLTQKLAATAPEDGDRQLDLAFSHYWLGNTCFLQRNLDKALFHHEAYLDITNGLVARDPTHNQWLLEKSYALNNVGAVLKEQGRGQEALTYFRRSVDIKEKLVTRDPRAETNLELASSYDWLANQLQDMGSPGEALSLLMKASDLIRNLLEGEPDNVSWLDRLAVTQSQIAHNLDLSGDFKGALDYYQSSLVLRRQLVGLDPINTNWRYRLAANHCQVTKLLLSLKRPDAVEAELDKAFALFEKLLETDPDNISWQGSRARAHHLFARALLAQGNPQAALVQAEQAVKRFEEIGEDVDRETTRLYVSAIIFLGRVENRLGRAEQARRLWARAYEITEPVVNDSPNIDYLMLHASALLLLGRGEDAEPAVDRLRQLGYADPDFWELSQTSLAR